MREGERMKGRERRGRREWGGAEEGWGRGDERGLSDRGTKTKLWRRVSLSKARGLPLWIGARDMHAVCL